MKTQSKPEQPKLDELLLKKEELLPELKPYLHKSKLFGSILQSPLVYSVPHVPQMNAFANAQFRMKKQKLGESLSKKDWHQYVFWHERPFRLPAFTEVMEKLNPREYWNLLSSVWVDAENIWQYKSIWKMALFEPQKKYASAKRFFMSVEDRNKYLHLAPMLRVYRGCNVKNIDGFSWTLNKEKAEWFATRFNSNESMVISGWVDKQKILGYMTSRQEEEIVVLPKYIDNKSASSVKRKKV